MSDLSQAQLAAFAEQSKHADENQRTKILVVMCLAMALSTAAVGLRLYARKFVRASWSYDDLIIFICLVLTLSCIMVINIATCYYGAGRHAVTIKPWELVSLLKSDYSSEILYSIAQGLYKISILLYYRRIFTSRRVRIAIWSLIVAVCCATFAFTIAVALQCVPVARIWNPKLPGTCLKMPPFLLTFAIINILFDASILVLPTPLVWRLQISTSKKLTVCGVFLLGGFVVISSVCRAIYIRRLTNGAGSFDPSWANVAPGIWSVVELVFGITCACLPSTWPLFVAATKRVLSYSGSRRHAGASDEDYESYSHKTPGASKKSVSTKPGSGLTKKSHAADASREKLTDEDVERGIHMGQVRGSESKEPDVAGERW